MSRECDFSAAGLIAGTVPTKGISGQRVRRCGSTSVEAVLQAIDDDVGNKGRCKMFDDRYNAFDDLLFGEAAVGKGRIVCSVEIVRVRAQPQDLVMDGQSAEPESNTSTLGVRMLRFCFELRKRRA